MNFWVIRISLGIVVYLSFSALNSDRSLASSLKFSDRYELTKVSNDPLLSDESLLIPNSNNQSQLPASSISNFSFIQKPIESKDFQFSHTQKPSASFVLQDLKELFSQPEFEVEVQIGSEKEEDNLWSSIGQSLTNLQFRDNEDNNVLNNPNVIILPQVAFQDIYRGIYDFEINLAAVSTIAPRVANSPIPDVYLVSQESIVNYSPAFLASQALRNAPEDYLRPEGYISDSSSLMADSNSSENNINLNQLNSLGSEDYYEDLSERVKSLVSSNINVVPSIEDSIAEIELETKYKAPNPIQKFQSQKDPKLQKMEEELSKEQQKLANERRSLLQKLKNEQKQRESKRQQEAEKLARERENERRKQISRQEQIVRRQESLFGKN